LSIGRLVIWLFFVTPPRKPAWLRAAAEYYRRANRPGCARPLNITAAQTGLVARGR